MQFTVSRDKKTDQNPNPRQITVDYPIGATLDENVEMHGKDAVNDTFVAKAKVKVGDRVRQLLKQDLTDKEIHAKVAELKLNERRVRAKKSPKERAMADYENMTPEQQAEFLEELRKKAKQNKS